MILQPTDTKNKNTFNPFDGPKVEKVIYATQSQAEIWIGCRLGGEDANRSYNESVSVILKGDLDVTALEKALQQLVQRHEALRAIFSTDGRFMTILEEVTVPLEVVDLTQRSDSEKKDDAAQYILADANKIFDLVKGPLLRAGLLKLNQHEYQLVLTAHHIICDGWSTGIMIEELGLLYSSNSSHENFKIPDAIPFSDFSDEHQNYLESDAFRETEQFWLDQYQPNVPELNLPTDFPRPEVRNYKSDRLDFPLDSALLAKLKKTGVRVGSSFVTTLMTTFELLLCQQTGQNDIVLGLPAAGQAVTGKTQLVGHCVNLLPLRSKVVLDQPFNAYLKHRKSLMFDAYDHQQLSFGQLLQKLPIARDPSRIPLVPVVFNIDMGMSNLVFFKDLTFKLKANPRTYEAFEIFLNASGSEDDFVLEWQYNASLFKASTIKKMMSALEDIIEKIVENPERAISEIIKTDDTDYKTLNATAATYSNLPLHELLTQQAQKYSTKVALKFSDTKITYKDLEEKSQQLAHCLMSKGIAPGDFVGVCLPRSMELMVTLKALLLCGAAYIPLDPSYPMQRLNYMLRDSEAPFLITTTALASRLETETTVLILNEVLAEGANFSTSPVNVAIDAQSNAYMLYTSGSTGKPKGVVVTHKNLVNFLFSMMTEPGMQETDRLLSITTVSFDIAGLELFLPLLTGATLVLADELMVKDGRVLLEALKKEGITMVQATPTTWKMLLDVGWDQPLPIRALCGGESLPLSLAKKLIPKVNELWNMYGPTETTIWSSTKQILSTDTQITIGHPIANTQFYIVNAQGMLMGPGQTGELVIGGDGVSKGYWKREDLTQEKFITASFETESDSKLYRTGDLGQLLPNGELMCLGRIDQQVKIRGHRIELEEIEQALENLEGIERSVVVVEDDLLVTYFVSHEIDELPKYQIKKWKQQLAEELPTPMIPYEYRLIAKFPTTLNGKIDRKALLQTSTKTVSNSEVKTAQTAIEKLVSSIWSEVLNKTDINITSDFFELGGHSILAIKVVTRLEKETGKKLPLSALMLYPTIEKLAAFIDKDDKKQSWNSLVPLKTEGNKTPLYIIHGAHFGIYVFNELAKLLDDDQPVYALQPKGLDGKIEPLDAIEDMAAHYISEMEVNNPNGPYAIAGFSMGGIIAFEMAKQLKAKGREVSMLASFDSYVFPSYFYKDSKKKRVASFLYGWAQKAYVFLNMFSSVKNFKRRMRLLKLSLEGIYLRLKLGHEKQFELQHNRTLKMDRMHSLACMKYVMEPQDISVDLFKAEDNVFFAHDFKYLGWRKFAQQGVQRHMIPGNHLDMFDTPNVEVYAKRLQEVLDQRSGL
ncbi:non-ribosomal peptide synthetase [Winogradskyella arenosi]|uniref:Amino acid adenylation domain-containing protein n=1 Tax=Winogradskyella arenosi TaxID=533325 RepID=A0A368ZIM9_9FLAO|nr:non-ribosomal peptide synthetase [Winogradskyella arenosi]RCW92497.1 amino acid adenylation domain-containing protein [Winogradskyella arenosi]